MFIWRHLTTIQTDPYRGEYACELVARGRTEGRSEGRSEGRTAGELMFLDARGLEVTGEARTRNVDRTDPDQLGLWIRLSATAGSVAELFDRVQATADGGRPGRQRAGAGRGAVRIDDEHEGGFRPQTYT